MGYKKITPHCALSISNSKFSTLQLSVDVLHGEKVRF